MSADAKQFEGKVAIITGASSGSGGLLRVEGRAIGTHHVAFLASDEASFITGTTLTAYQQHVDTPALARTLCRAEVSSGTYQDLQLDPYVPFALTGHDP